jgi:hypothetical protein
MQSRWDVNKPLSSQITAAQLAKQNSQPPPPGPTPGPPPPPFPPPAAEPVAVPPQKTAHVEALGFAAAMPEIIFRKIFSNLSPAFLYHFCRPVCKAWKQHIDRHLIHFINQKGFLQLLMCDDRPVRESHRIDPNCRVYSTIYHAIGNKENYDGTVKPENQNTVIFKPLVKGKPYIVNYDWTFPPYAMYERDWRILDIVSSLFPAPRRESPSTFYREHTYQDIHERHQRRFHGHRRQFKLTVPPISFSDSEIHFYDPIIEKGTTMTEKEVNDFNNLTPSPSNTLPITKSSQAIDDDGFLRPTFNTENSLSSLEFPNPKVFLDIRMGEYILKCRFHTELRCIPPDPQLQYAGWFIQQPSWQQKSTLIIDSIETSLHNLLTWNCGCPSKQCPIQKILSRPVITTFGPYQNVSYVPGCETSVPYENPIHQNVFPYFPCKDRNYWFSQLSQFGDSAASSFVPQNALAVRASHKVVSKPRKKCEGCKRGVETGKFDLDLRRDSNVVLWASGRCNYGLCGRCCVMEMCRGHKLCLNCRWNWAAPPWITSRKPCLKIFGGEICKGARIDKKKIDDDDMEY